MLQGGFKNAIGVCFSQCTSYVDLTLSLKQYWELGRAKYFSNNFVSWKTMNWIINCQEMI